MLDRLYEDSDLLALNKPHSVSVLQDRSGAPNLFDEIRDSYPEAQLVHRLDKGTSGVLLVAKSLACKRSLSRAFAKQKIGKYYISVVCGHMPGGRSLSIDMPLKQGRKHRFRVAGLREEIRSHAGGWNHDSDQGYASKTTVRLWHQGSHRSLIVCRPTTGRTHQLRVHLSWIGHAVVGDELYGSPKSDEQRWTRMALHCHRIDVPQFGSITADLPNEFWDALKS